MTDKTALMQKIAVGFEKTGPAIYHSHHDMIRFWERAVRRAGLPVRLTRGFNPRPRMVFPHALGLGVASRHEEIELELYARTEPSEIVAGLSRACAGVLSVAFAVDLPASRKGRRIRESSYRLTGWPATAAVGLAAAVAELLARSAVILARGAPGEERSVDIRPFLKSVSFDAPTLTVESVFIHGNSGSARPDELVALLAAGAAVDRHSIAVEKTGMVLE